MLFLAAAAAAQVRPVRDVRRNTNQGVPELLGQTVTVTGVVTEAGHFGNWGPAFVQDSTGGVAVYGSAVADVHIGDSVTVTGEVTNFSGLTEIEGPTIVNHGAVEVRPPREFELAWVDRIDTAAGYVETEGWLVRFDSIEIEHAAGEEFQGNRNYTISDPGSGEGQMRIDADALELVGMMIPDGWVPLVGLIGQYRPSPPHFGGYQVMPRTAADLGFLPRPLLTIAEAQRPGPDGVTPALLDSVVRVRGVVSGPASSFTSGASSFFIQDTTQGVNVYNCASPPADEPWLDSIGVEWEVVATVTEYNGLTELANGTMFVTDTVRLAPAVRLLPFNIGLTETMESDLVSVVADVVQAPYPSGPGYNMTVKNGNAALAVRINNATGISTGALTRGRRIRIIGIVGQYDNSPPYTSGYQLMPRFQSDLFDTSGAFPPVADLVLDTIAPNPFVPGRGEVASIQLNAPTAGCRLTVGIYDLEGRHVRELLANAPGGYYDLKWDGTDALSRPQPAGIYLVNVKAARSSGRTETISRPVVLAVKLN